jgi:flagellar hook assembly protein FlgD
VLPRGAHAIAWDGRDDSGAPVAAGVYFCRVKAGDAEQVRTAVLLK